MKKTALLMVCIAVFGIADAANGAEVLWSTNITAGPAVTWTSNNTYNLQQQIFVEPGATLIIEAGTVIASTTNLGGSLAVCNGGQIFVNGTRDNPVVMTSKADVATWIGGNPKTGIWRAAANEWGNLTLMGDGYISENATPGNVPTPNANNVAAMEGLVGIPGHPTWTQYGGGNDNDDSGDIHYLSLRYGGKVISLNNELNGLSLGGIGRDTDIHHVEIMNNVDDGIEIWGGAVNLKYFSIWNIGDDSFDVDQGWRGKAQFGLIVQGYSVDAKQGSGVGDNCFETDGAEDSDWQPVTTTSIWNCTVVGQPVHGDGATAWRDDARVQYHSCVFMDCGEKVVRFDNDDGDGASGYGHNGTLDWPTTWTTAYNAVPAHANDPANPALFYQSQSSGKLAEITDSVFFRNQHSAAYTEANARGVFNAANNNVQIAGIADSASPLMACVRGAPVYLYNGTLIMVPVDYLDPRPMNQAATSLSSAPNDGFFTPVNYRGAFANTGDWNWLAPWSASYAFGFIPKLYPDTYTLSESAGGTINFTIDEGPELGNMRYHILGSVSGYAPGLSIPFGPHLPLNWDPITDLLLNLAPLFPGFHSFMDANGDATATFATGGPLPPGTAPIRLYWAFLAYNPANSYLLDASNFCYTDIVP